MRWPPSNRSLVDTSSAPPGESVGDAPATELLPLTSYAALGLLSPKERYTAVEIQVRAYQQLRHFYWAPALSHIRRELNRLDDMGYVDALEVRQGRVKRTLKYRITELGSKALAEWAERPDADPLIVKNSVILRLWLGRRADNAHLVLQALERHIDHVEAELAALDLQIETSEAHYDERVVALQAIDDPEGSDLQTLVSRTAWHLGVMRYCRRGYEQELRNSAKLLRELTALAASGH